MYRDYPDYRRGTLDKGFVLTGIFEVVADLNVIAGGVGYYDMLLPVINEFHELLCLVVLTSNIPAVPPDEYVEHTFAALVRRGIMRPLTLGDTVNFYELDLSAIRVFAYKTTNLEQRLSVRLTANALAATDFNVRGLIARYTFAT